ncbi:hypothetical protein BN126_1924 [Cronobacter sakazakii 680]|nr:hypothetical protein BN126_1924 [Cronobacter sakazakii 680]
MVWRDEHALLSQRPGISVYLNAKEQTEQPTKKFQNHINALCFPLARVKYSYRRLHDSANRGDRRNCHAQRDK